MAHELDLQVEWQRLYELYHALSDDELLELAERPDDLTEIALDVMRREIKQRRLLPQTVSQIEPIKAPIANGQTAGEELVQLTSFNDAFRARIACQLLEEHGVHLDLRDLSYPQYGLKAAGDGPPVLLGVFVSLADYDRSTELLRDRMGLFPESEVAHDDGTSDEDEEVIMTVAYFDTRDDADEAIQLLNGSRIWHRTTTPSTMEDAPPDSCDIEVRACDILQASKLLEDGLGLSNAKAPRHV